MLMLRREKGFTLIELLIVVAIIGIIAAIAVPNLLTAIQRSKRSRTVADIRAIGTALGSYQVDNNVFPWTQNTSTTLSDKAFRDSLDEGMTSSYYEGSSRDGWGKEFFYCSDGQGYTLVSHGKDRGIANGGEFDSNIVYVNGSFQAPANVKN
jgi:type II secretion system protein G